MKFKNISQIEVFNMYAIEYTDGNYARELLYEAYELNCIFDVIHNGT